LLWFLWGVSRASPTASLGVTLFGFLWVGVLGSFAALLLAKGFPNGNGILLGGIIATVAFDVAAFFVGSQVGRSPMAPNVSPHKTWEGSLAGLGGALLAGAIIVPLIDPWSFRTGLALGVVAAVAGTLGDLSESMIKRDLGIKDMGTLLPGHGGLFDRIDAMLFVVPATYYLARAANLLFK